MPKMPADNRMHSGAALHTSAVWTQTIGYDPYAPLGKEEEEELPSSSGPVAPNPFESYKGLLALARLQTSGNQTAVKGACKRCGGVGHLTFQCFNTKLGAKATPANLNEIPVPEEGEEEEEEEASSSNSESEHHSRKRKHKSSGSGDERPRKKRKHNREHHHHKKHHKKDEVHKHDK